MTRKKRLGDLLRRIREECGECFCEWEVCVIFEAEEHGAGVCLQEDVFFVGCHSEVDAGPLQVEGICDGEAGCDDAAGKVCGGDVGVGIIAEVECVGLDLACEDAATGDEDAYVDAFDFLLDCNGGILKVFEVLIGEVIGLQIQCVCAALNGFEDTRVGVLVEVADVVGAVGEECLGEEEGGGITLCEDTGNDGKLDRLGLVK